MLKKENIENSIALQEFENLTSQLEEVRKSIKDISLVRHDKIIIEKLLEEEIKYMLSEFTEAHIKSLVDLNKEIIEEIINKKIQITETFFEDLYVKSTKEVSTRINVAASKVIKDFMEKYNTLEKIQ